jgi:hypothetical protein
MSWEGEDYTTNAVPSLQHNDYDMGPDTPLTFSFITPENRLEGPLRLTVPDSQFQALLPENITRNDLPNPLRESDFYADGQKIKPDAHMRITSHLSIPYQEAIDNQTFEIGKLIGYLRVRMFQKGQHPSLIRANIQEPAATTYGSLYEISPVVTQSGPAYTAAGFEVNGITGDPYEAY